ncbi:pentatricopeptide repeat-containing protein At2g22410, mitochondrial-like [Nymphaea colorata]|uniref:DYW domain-containing protein n=1 Tax=Nymphaea colorata TaxID=210225 RepID=A0A5K1CIN2_9MAGN|nr:pentatricopeptide repeat-containing protein At2g22410, mitochondrial-like [Nymphaea colorata]
MKATSKFLCLAVGCHHRPALVISLASHSISEPKFTGILNFRFHSLLEGLESCRTMKEVEQIHARLVVNPFVPERKLAVGKLVALYALSDCAHLRCARLLLAQTDEQNVFMYNGLIRAYCFSRNPEESLLLYRQLLRRGLLPNEFTIPFVLKACVASESGWCVGMALHLQVVKLGYEPHVVVGNALVHFYVVLGWLDNAHQAFDEIPEKSVVSWNSMIAGYSQYSFPKVVFELFRTMREEGVEPDEVTFVSVLSVCSEAGEFNWGRAIHGFVVRLGVEIDTFVMNALMDMYAKCDNIDAARWVFKDMAMRNVVSWTTMVAAHVHHGMLDVARQIFEQMPERNIISWNTMIAGYCQGQLYTEGLKIFGQMWLSNSKPDEVTLSSVLAICSHIGDLRLGREAHVYICASNMKFTVALTNSLIDMYAKCGRIDIALHLFNSMRERSLVSWNVIISALAMHGHASAALDIFSEMQEQGVVPDDITFVGLLSACSHGGLLQQGRFFFKMMKTIYNLLPEIQHYACMVDLLGRGGYLEEAKELIDSMPMKPDIVVWGAFLGACRIHGNVDMGEQVIGPLLEVEQENGGLYVLLSNIYCEANWWEDVKKIRKLMKDKGIKKCKAVSLIEINGFVHEFTIEDKRHDISDDLYLLLDQLTDHMRSVDYFSTSPSSLSSFDLR